MTPPRLSLLQSPALSSAQTWFEARSRREQLLLGVLGALALATVLWFGVFGPLFSVRAEAKARIAAYEALKTRLKSGVTPGQPVATGDLTAVINTTAASAALTLTTADQGAVTLREARYESVIAWLAGLEASGVTIQSLSMTPGSAPGQVNVRLQVTK